MRGDKYRPVFMIGVAAELAGVHPQTLRIYERKRLVEPQRTSGNTRLYSEADIERLRLIQQLTQDEGINLAGVVRILEAEDEHQRLQDEIDGLRAQVRALKREALEEEIRAARRSALVPIADAGLLRFEFEDD